MIKHWNILKLQNYAFIGFTCFTFLLFLATIVFSTSYYNSYLYGNEELVEFYTNELQSFNQQAFIFCIVLVLLFVVCRLFQPKKYYPTFITFPILCSSLTYWNYFGNLNRCSDAGDYPFLSIL